MSFVHWFMALFLYCSSFDYHYPFSNYCDRNSCRFITLSKIEGMLIAIAFKIDNKKNYCDTIRRAITIKRANKERSNILIPKLNQRKLRAITLHKVKSNITVALLEIYNYFAFWVHQYYFRRLSNVQTKF